MLVAVEALVEGLAPGRGRHDAVAAGKGPMLAQSARREHLIAAGSRKVLESCSSTTGEVSCIQAASWPAAMRWSIRVQVQTRTFKISKEFEFCL